MTSTAEQQKTDTQVTEVFIIETTYRSWGDHGLEEQRGEDDGYGFFTSQTAAEDFATKLQSQDEVDYAKYVEGVAAHDAAAQRVIDTAVAQNKVLAANGLATIHVPKAGKPRVPLTFEEYRRQYATKLYTAVKLSAHVDA
jgi:hypothetical protein